MKKITIYLLDETAEIIDKIAQDYQYRKYPQYQAYGLIIDEVVAELNNLSKMPVNIRCPLPLSRLSYEDIVFPCIPKKKGNE